MVNESTGMKVRAVVKSRSDMKACTFITLSAVSSVVSICDFCRVDSFCFVYSIFLCMEWHTMLNENPMQT